MGLLEKELIEFISRFDANPFTLKLPKKDYLIGDGTPDFSVVFHEIPSIKDLLTSTSLALGEAYMKGTIEIEGNLYTALNSFMSQLDQFCFDHKKLKKLMHPSTSKQQQKKEVSSHYDLGNDFYSLWLDETMSYSCGYFANEDDSLFEAQKNKVHRILKKLDLKEGMTLCDIGCGWGYLLLEAAKKYKVKGLGITLSVEQKKKFEEEIKKNHLEEYLSVELLDYRELPKKEKQFDRLVSVGMIEHVGRENYSLFLECAKSILKPSGLFLLHFISSLKESSGDPWIKKYIFPGGVIPSFREIIVLSSDLHFHPLDVESMRRHYSKTLLCWNDNFQQNKKQIKDMFDEQFVAMWELYLCSCAASFANGNIDLHQILFSNGVNNKVPMTRWY